MKLSPSLLLSEWHPTKNLPLTPSDVKNSQKIWWVCEKGHEWEAKVHSRVQLGRGCPYCAGRKAIPGETDLMTTHPELEAEWDKTRNKLDPATLSAGSNRKAWWVGKCGHSWEAVIISRVRGSGCPYCSNRKVLPGFNDLATTHPHLAEQWHPDFNQVAVNEVIAGSEKKVWWLGECGHEWEATINSRVRGNGCPVCNNKLPTLEASLLVLHPEIANQWHPEKNKELKPSKTAPGSNRRIWWVCEKGHEWEATPYTRVKGHGCPYCSNRKALPGFNDLGTSHPHLAKQWHPTKNGTEADFVSAGSDVKAWWVCDKGHEWETWVYARLKNNCPVCYSKTFVSVAEKDIASFIEGELNLKVLQNSRKVLARQELDIYVPEKSFAVEFNGVYWHSELYKSKNSHYDKWLACKNQGIQLVQVWEDDWNRNPDLVKRMLAHKLGVSEDRKVYARGTCVVTVSKTETERFLNFNHIQGHGNGSYYLGLEELGSKELVAVLVLKKEAGTDGKTLNIIRYATSVNVIGGFTKLLKHAEKTYKPDKFITFSDHCVSDGGLYEKNGFVADKELPPDYMYVVRGERKHKFGYRLKKFRDDPNLLWEEGLSEKQLAELNQIPRIWDAGKTRWVKFVK